MGGQPKTPIVASIVFGVDSGHESRTRSETMDVDIKKKVENVSCYSKAVYQLFFFFFFPTTHERELRTCHKLGVKEKSVSIVLSIVQEILRWNVFSTILTTLSQLRRKGVGTRHGVSQKRDPPRRPADVARDDRGTGRRAQDPVRHRRGEHVARQHRAHVHGKRHVHPLQDSRYLVPPRDQVTDGGRNGRRGSSTWRRVHGEATEAKLVLERVRDGLPERHRRGVRDGPRSLLLLGLRMMGRELFPRFRLFVPRKKKKKSKM